MGRIDMTRLNRILRPLIPAAAIIPVVAACTALVPPKPGSISTEARLEAFDRLPVPPFEGAVEIRWNDHLVPYILAETDTDGAFALGLVHAHLRLGQMEAFKRISQGRISEMAGPFTTEIDAAIRAMGFGRATPETLRRMPAASRDWLDAYVDGVNFYKDNTEARPPEFAALGLGEEPWTAEDTVTMGRLTSADFTWIVLPQLLELWGTPDWAEVWAQLAELGGGEPRAGAAGNTGERTGVDREARPRRAFAQSLRRTARLGSNSLAVAPARSATGAALIANDPHLGLQLPNVWLIAGMRTPSYKTVGMTIPGLPVFAFGRTPCLAWGGTNLHGWNTDLIDLRGRDGPFTRERHDIGVRFWFDATAENRVAEEGPVISDAAALGFPPGETYAARWTGHLPSDEITAMLDLLRAPNGRELARILKPFAGPAQNFIHADCEGNIGNVVATWLPDRPTAFPEDIAIDPETSARHWRRILTSGDLPAIENPARGYVVSGNDRAFDAPPTRIGLLFSPKQRVERLAALIEAQERVDLDDLSAMQRDVYSAGAHGMARLIAASAPPDAPLAADLAGWAGAYEVDSRGALAYEAAMTRLAPAIFDAAGRATEMTFWLETGYLDVKAAKLLETFPPLQRREMVKDALAAATGLIGADEVWGDRHRLANQHVLGMIPILGAGYRNGDFPTPGGRETVMKSGDDLEVEPHTPSYGSQARHISDLGDPDANFFVLLGGQDGWFGSRAFDDQIPLWRAGESIRMPLSLKAIREQFPIASRFARGDR